MIEPDIPYGYCHCGCGQKTSICNKTDKKRGYVKGKPMMFVHYHAGVAKGSGPDYCIDVDTGCWEWLRYVGNHGYGMVSRNKKKFLAHRHYYEAWRGEIPDGLQIDHLCRNRRCVNPWHMEIVTIGENIRRGLASKINREIADEIRELYSTGKYYMKELGKMFGISPTAVSSVVRMKSWT